MIGMPPDVPPYSYTVGEWQFGTSPNLVAGTLTGMDESERDYFLSYRDGLVTEVLPCPVWHGSVVARPRGGRALRGGMGADNRFSPAVLRGRQPRAVAAAVDRLVGYRAGEQAIRKADRAVRPLLALGPDHPGD